jgi:hypothetical protein
MVTELPDTPVPSWSIVNLVPVPLTGGATDDILIGGAGDDTLTGAGGRDIFDASVKLEISQLPISWLKAPAPLNIECILVTLPTFQSPMSWLKVLPLTKLLTVGMLGR